MEGNRSKTGSKNIVIQGSYFKIKQEMTMTKLIKQNINGLLTLPSLCFYTLKKQTHTHICSQKLICLINSLGVLSPSPSFMCEIRKLLQYSSVFKFIIRRGSGVLLDCLAKRKQ